MARDIEEIATIIVDAAIKVHRALGPGLLESAHQHCLAHELRKRGLQVQTEVAQPVMYDDERIDVGYGLDMLVENAIIIENKTVEEIAPIHRGAIVDLSQTPSMSPRFPAQLERIFDEARHPSQNSHASQALSQTAKTQSALRKIPERT